MTLEECRNHWEKGLNPIFLQHTQDNYTVLVILSCGEKIYDCHRYFTLGGGWECSVDFRNAGLPVVFEWLIKNY